MARLTRTAVQGFGRPVAPRGRAVWAVALVVVLLAGGAVAPAVAQSPVTIGAPIALTGNLADSAAHVKRGYELWL